MICSTNNGKSLNGDEQRNNARIQIVSRGKRALWGADEAPSVDDLQRISPSNYLDRIMAALSIHHGLNDTIVPPVWSAELCQQLQALGKTVECFTYADQPHTFVGAGDSLFVQRTINFFNQYLK